MAIASGARTQLAYVAESTRGTTPGSPTMKVLRAITRDLNLVKNPLRSEEIRTDRQVSDVRHGFNRVEGSIPCELALQTMDDMIEAALGGAWAAGTNVTTVAAVDSGNKITRASGSFVTDGYRPGDIVTTAGFTTGANNGIARVTAVSALELTLASADLNLADEAADVSQSVNLTGKRVNIGTTLKTFTFERQILDLVQYQPFTGVAIDSMEVNVTPEQISRITFGLLGMGGGSISGSSLDSSPDAAPTNRPMSSFDGVLYEGGTAIAVVTGVRFTLNNGRSLEPVVGSDTSPDVFEGTAAISGELTAFFTDTTLYNKFKNETESSLWLKLDDPDSATSFLNFVLPRVKYMSGNIAPPREGPVPITMQFEALVHETYGTSLWVQRSNA